MTAAVRPRRPETPALSVAYPLLSGYFRARGWLNLRDQPAVLVYQMAKVGSQTVVASIRASQPGCPVFHVHTLTHRGLRSMERFYRQSIVPSLPGGGHLLVSRYLKEQLRQGITPGKWKVVTMVRDPVARNISLLFQLGRRLLPDLGARCDAGRLDPVAVMEEFATVFPGQVDCMRWFPDELQRVFGIDVFATPFNREAGHQVYSGPFADVLLIKTESLDSVGEDAFRSFLGLGPMQWKQANIGARKNSNGARYANFLKQLHLSPAFVDRYYDSPEVRHFYTPAELYRFRSRWVETRVTP